ncbi:MAG: hypothetical protein FJ125_15325, partial [Deltaproteobacteria bacterium]|nr:hypothetical protein [Deltaproteobacteria bacterium]
MRSTPKFLRVLLLFCCSGLLLACGDKKLTADFPLEVLARAAGSEGQGVEGVALKLNDQEIGQTDEEGRFEGTFHGIEGQMVVLEIIPPDDFKLDEGSESTIKGVLTVDRPEDGEPKPKALSFLVDLKPISVDYVAIVSAPGKFRPIYLGDELKGRTNALGVEILHFRGKPGTEVQLRVDTQSKKNAPLLKKVMLDEHERVLTIDDKDEVKEESEAEKATRAKEAEEREQKALAQLEEKAKKQGGKTAVEKVEKVKAAPKEQEQADEADLEAVRQFSPKSVVKIETAAAATPKKETPPPAPVAEPFDKKAAGDIAKDVKKIHAAVSKAKAETGKVGGKLAKLAKQ